MPLYTAGGEYETTAGRSYHPRCLRKEGSFAAASAKLFKTPSALSYTVHKLESDLNIQILDRSGHRAKFTRTGQMLLEKGGRCCIPSVNSKKQAIKLHEGWENELVIGVDDTFPFSLLAPLIESFYQHHSVTRLKFINGVLGGSWDALIQGRADIIVGAMHETPQRANLALHGWGSGTGVCGCAASPAGAGTGTVKSSHYSPFRAIVVGDNAQHANVSGSQVLDDQEAITVFDFKTKLELQISGLGCGYIPRYLAQRFLESGALIEKKWSRKLSLNPWDRLE